MSRSIRRRHFGASFPAASGARRHLRPRRLLLEPLEERRLLAEGESLGLDPLSLTSGQLSRGSGQGALAEESGPVTAAAAPVRRELLVVDAGVQDYQRLLDDVRQVRTDDGRQIEAILIDTAVDGVGAVTRFLEQVGDLDAIHVVSHGGPGALQLGRVTLAANNLDQYGEQLRRWRSALAGGADVLLYGCDLAAGESGREFLESLANMTGADVAASDDRTGAMAAGGDWELEQAVGHVDTRLAFSAETLARYRGSLAILQTYFIPLPENQVRDSFVTLQGAAAIGATMRSVTSISVPTSGTAIYYDHWEDGYEPNLASPVQATTRVWGDNNPANGIPPGFTTDVLTAGSVIALDNNVLVPKGATPIQYDGRDKFGSTQAVAVARAQWALTPGTVLGTSASVYDTLYYGTSFEAPVGQNLSSREVFQYSSLYIQAAQGGTTVTVDLDGAGPGGALPPTTLAQGEVLFVNGGVQVGATVTSNLPVQVHMLTGDSNLSGSSAQYESRTFTLFPADKLSHEYFNPVGTVASAAPGFVWLHNPGGSTITVRYQTASTSGTIVVAAHETQRFPMPTNSGARFYTDNSADVFSAVFTNDADQNNDGNTTWDWGMTLRPGSTLSTAVAVGWGPGSADLTVNGSPVWFTTNQAGTVYVDNDGNPATGAFTDPAGGRYDQKFTVAALQSTRVFDAADKNQTGMRLYSLDDTLIAAAWGEDASTAGTANPYLDLGYALMPLPVWHLSKTSTLLHNNDGSTDELGAPTITAGDDVRYEIRVHNTSLVALASVVVLDALPAHTSYLAGSTTVNGSPLTDNPSPASAYPLDEAGLTFASIPSTGEVSIEFTVRVQPLPAGVTTVGNTATASIGGVDNRISTDTFTVAASPPPTLDLDTGAAGSNYAGCFQAGGTAVSATGAGVAITDPGPTLTSAVIRLSNRPDGSAELLLLDRTQASSRGISVADDGAGGFRLSGTAALADYQAVLATLRYMNTLAAPTLVNRVIQVTVNDGVADSNTALATLHPPTAGAFTGSPGGAAVSSYYENSTVYLSVNDQTANANTGASESLAVTVTSSGGDSETVTLAETGVNTGIFVGSIPSSTAASVPDSGTLTAVAGNTLSASHASVGGCDSWTGTAGVLAPDFEQKQLYFSSDSALDRVDPASTNDTTTSSQPMVAPLGGADMAGSLVFAAGVNSQVSYQAWSGESYAPTAAQSGLSSALVETMAGAAAPTRNEKLVLVANNDSPDSVNALLWNGTSWSVLTRGTLGIGGTSSSVAIGASVTGTFYAGDVAYEQHSGDAMMVWNDGGTLRYSVYNGTSWTSGTIDTLAVTARQIRLAADPNSDRIAMVVNFQNELDLAYIWDGAAWGAEQLLDGNTGHNRTDINVAFEAKSGDALVVYATGTAGNVGYYSFSGGMWAASGSLTPPAGTDGYARWTVLAADPTSDRLVLGVETNGPAGAANTADVWTRVWNGSTWGTASVAASNIPPSAGSLGVAVAFESLSGEALVVYPSAGNTASYRTWTGSSWSASTAVPGGGFGQTVNVVTLDANPYSNQIMFSLQDAGSDLNELLWDGAAWTDMDPATSGSQFYVTPTANTGNTSYQPFLYLWDAYRNTTPLQPFNLFTTPADYDGPDAGTVTGADAYVQVTSATNYGAAATLTVQENGASDRVGLIQFDLSGISGATVQSATLRVTVTAATAGTINLYRVTSAWAEGTVNGTGNLPSWDPGTVVGTFSPTATGVYSIDLTALAQQWLDNKNGTGGQPNYGVALVNPSTTALLIQSKEGSAANQPVLTVRTRDATTAVAMFTQTPALAAPLEILTAAPVTVTSYIQVTNGNFVNPPNIDVAVKDGTATLLNLTDPVLHGPVVTTVNAAQKIYRLQWSGTLATNLPAGHALSATLTSNESFSFNILYDSTYYPSQISLATDTVITLDSVGVYDAPYPGGALVSNAELGETIYVRITASDPFGAADITSADVVFKDQTGNVVQAVSLTDLNVVAATASSKTYEYARTLSESGRFVAEVTVHEGYEGTVTATGEVPLDVAVYPDLTLAKTDGSVAVSAGQTIAYLLSYRNVGAGQATGVTVRETLPANTSFNSGGSTAGWSEDPAGTFTYTVGSLAPGAGGSVTFAVTVDSRLPAGLTEVLNQATIPQVAGEQVTSNNAAADATPVTAAPDLRVSKTETVAGAAFDFTAAPYTDTVSYTLTYENVGTQDAAGVYLTETLPPHTTLDPTSLGTWTLVSGQQYRYDVPGGTLAAGAGPQTVTVAVRMTAPVPEGLDLLTNTATIADNGANGADLNLADNTASDETPVLAGPDLTVAKTDGGMGSVTGGTVLYTISYSNIGTQDARQVTLTETLPANTTFDPLHSVGDWQNIGVDLGGNQQYQLMVGDLAVGASGTATLAIVPAAAAVPQIVNTVSIADDGSNGDDLEPDDNKAAETTPIAAPAPTDADLQITKTDGRTEVNPGAVVTYTLVVRNAGPAAVAGASVVDVFPAQLTGVTYSSAATGGATGHSNPAGGQTEIRDTVDLPAGSSITYTVTGTVAAGASGLLTNLATVTASVVDPDTSNNTALDQEPIIRVSDLSLGKGYARTNDADSSGSTTPGDTVVFALTVTNAGPQDATGVVVADNLPTGFQYLSDDAAVAGDAYVPGTGLWQVGDLANGASATLRITALVNGSGSYANVAQVASSDNPDPDSTPANSLPTEDDYASVTVPVVPKSDLSLTKLFTAYVDNDFSSNLSAGDTATFTLSLSNAGPSVATGVTVQELLPSGYTFVNYSGSGTYNGGTGLWTVGAVNVLETKTLTIRATLNGGLDPATGAYSNYAQVLSSTSYDPDSVPANNSTGEDDNATAAPLISDLSLTKTVALAPGGDVDGSGGPSAGDTVVFTVTASNAGPNVDLGVVVRDAIPTGYGYLGNDGGATYASGILTWNVGPLGTTAPKVLNITATLLGGDSSADYANYAQIWSANNYDPDSTPRNNSTAEDDDAEARLPMADLSVSKAVGFSLMPYGDLDGSGSITVGDLVQFTLTVTNHGPDAATAVSVRDELPAGYTYASDTSNGAYNFTTGLWQVGTLEAAASRSVSILASVAGTSDLTNVVQLAASGTYDPDSTPGNDDPFEDDYFSIEPTLGQAADLALSKILAQTIDVDGSGGLSANDRLVFTLTLTNDGPSDATDVSVRDLLPVGLAWVSDDGGGRYDRLTGLWTVTSADQPEGTVLAGDSLTLTITTRLVGGHAAENAYTNYAQVWTADIWDPDSTPGDSSTTQDDDAVYEVPMADLSITKTCPGGTIVPGQTVLYQIVVHNDGPAAVVGARIRDLMPPGLTDVAYISGISGNASGNTARGQGNIDDVVTMAPGSTIGYSVTATVLSSATGVLANTATVTPPANTPDLHPDDNTATDSDVLVPQVDLRILKTDGVAEATAGDTVTYTIAVDNIGPSDAVGAAIQDVFPAWLENVTYTSTAVGATGNTASGSGNIADTVNMPAHSAIIYVVTGTIASGAAGSLTNTATVSAPPGVTDLDPTSNLSADADTLIPEPIADLSLTKTVARTVDADGSGTFTAGDTVTFTLTLVNSGPDTATGIQVVDVVPAGYTNIQDISPGGAVNGNEITWTAASLSAVPGANLLTFTFQAQLTATRSYTNLAEIRAADQRDPDSDPGTGLTRDDGEDGLPDDDEATITPAVQLVSDLSLTKTPFLFTDADVSGNISAGDTVRFNHYLANAGPDEVMGVSVVDVLPTGYTWVSGGAYDPLARTVTWSGINLAVGGNTILQTNVVVEGDMAEAAYWNYTEVASSPNFDPDSTPGNGQQLPPDADEDDDDAIRPPLADLRLEKTVATHADLDGSGGLTSGDTVEFTLTVYNEGPDAVTDVTIEDMVPFGYEWSSGGVYLPLSRLVTWYGLSLEKDETASVSFTATVVGGLPLSAYTNYGQIATSSAFDPDSAPWDDSEGDDDDDTIAVPISDLQLTKTVAVTDDPDGDGLTTGDEVTFTVTVTNRGPDANTGVVVEDIMGDGFTAPGYTVSTGTFVAGVWTVGDLAVNASAILTITATVDSSGPYSNFAQVTRAANLDPDSTPNNGSRNEDDDVTVTVVPGETADLSLTKTMTPPTGADDVDNSGGYSVADIVRFILEVHNGGPNAASGVQVRDRLPPGLGYISHSGDGSYDPISGMWNIGTITDDGSAQLELVTTLVASDVPNAYENYAEIYTSQQSDPDSTPNNGPQATEESEDDDWTTVMPISNLSLVKEVEEAGGDGKIELGETVAFTLTLQNDGPDDVTSVQVQDVVPAGYTVNEATISDGGTLSGGIITWSDLSLLDGASLELTFNAVVERGHPATAYLNYAQITSSPNYDPDSNPNDHSTTENDDATAAPLISDLSLTKVLDPALTPAGLASDADSSGGLSPGDQVRFLLTVTNAGIVAATGVRVADLLPSGYQWYSDDGAGSYDHATGVWTVGTVSAAAPRTLRITATIESSGVYVNTAEITASDTLDPDSLPNNRDPDEDDQASLTPSIALISDLRVVKILDPDPAFVVPGLYDDADGSGTITYGDIVDFDVYVTNWGPNDDTGVRACEFFGTMNEG